MTKIESNMSTEKDGCLVGKAIRGINRYFTTKRDGKITNLN